MQVRRKSNRKTGGENVEKERVRMTEYLKKAGMNIHLHTLSTFAYRNGIIMFRGDLKSSIMKGSIDDMSKAMPDIREIEKLASLTKRETGILKKTFGLPILAGFDKYHFVFPEVIPHDRVTIYRGSVEASDWHVIVFESKSTNYIVIATPDYWNRGRSAAEFMEDDIVETLIRNRVEPDDLIKIYEKINLHELAEALRENDILSYHKSDVEAVIRNLPRSLLSEVVIDPFPRDNPAVVIRLRDRPIWFTSRIPTLVMDRLKESLDFYGVTKEYDIADDGELLISKFRDDGVLVGKNGLTIPAPRRSKSKIPQKILKRGLKLIKIEAKKMERKTDGEIFRKKILIYMIYNRDQNIGVLWM